MAPPAVGNIEAIKLADGSVSFRGRFRAAGKRQRVVFGRDADGWTEARARSELDDICAQLKAGISLAQILERYAPRAPEDARDQSGPTFHEYASEWLRRRRRGELGHGPLADSTHADYLWRLSKHLLPFFAPMPIEQITDADCRRFRAKLFTEREQLKTTIAAGGSLTDRNGRPRAPLSLRSIQMMMAMLAQILDDAVEDKLCTHNPARSKRLRVRVPKPRRTFLEVDQLVALLDAARQLEAQPRSTKRAKLTAEQADEVRRRLKAGETQTALAREYGLSAGSMSMLANGHTYRGANGRVGWRALCATLAYAGPRIAEALDLRERDVRLHEPASARLWIADSKTASGVRHVEVTPSLRDELLSHRADKLRHGYPTHPDAPFFCAREGSRWNESNVRERILAAASDRASAQLVERGLPPLPHVTPHTLRRTYVSMMLMATNFDVPYVQSQVGHADSKMTMDVYAQLLDRSKREHGAAFDALINAARTGTHPVQYGVSGPPIGPLIGPPSPSSPNTTNTHPTRKTSTSRQFSDGRGWFRTSDLSRVKRALSH